MNKQIIKMYADRMELLGIETEDELANLSDVPQPTVHRIIKDEDYNPGCYSHSKVLKVLGIPCPMNNMYSNLDIDIINGLQQLDEKHKGVILSTIKSLQTLP